eukprot:gene16191-7563_t
MAPTNTSFDRNRVSPIMYKKIVSEDLSDCVLPAFLVPPTTVNTKKHTTSSSQSHVIKTSMHTKQVSQKNTLTEATSHKSNSISTVRGTGEHTVTKNRVKSKQIDTTYVITVAPTAKPAYQHIYCYHDLYKSIEWRKTRAGTTSKQFCPSGSTGFATRQCLLVSSSRAVWSNFIDTSACISVWVNLIESEVQNPSIEAAASTGEILSKASSKSLYGGDLIKISNQLKDLAKKAFTLDLKNPQIDQASKLNQEFMGIGNNLLDSNAWNGLNQKRRSRTASDLLKNLEDAALAIIKALGQSHQNFKRPLDAITPNIVSTSSVIDVDGDGEVSLISEDLKRNASLANKDWKSIGQVEIPRSTIRDVAGSEKKCFAACVIARNAGKLLPVSKNKDSINTDGSSSQFVNTFVTGLALSPKPKRPFPAPVTIVTKSLTVRDKSKEIGGCVFILEQQFQRPYLVTDGCHDGKGHCQRNNMPNKPFYKFAVLMKTGTGDYGSRHRFALMIITQVGIGISLLCLILAFSIFVNCKSLTSVRNTIHKNLCVALSFAYVVFVVGISRTENKIVCTVFATLLYYFLLVAFLWMLMEGIQLYILLVQIFPRGEGFKKQYYVVCWGFPAVLSVVLCGSHPHGFGNDNFCWLSAKDNFIWAFVVPVLIVIAVNSVFLFMTFKTIIRNSSIVTREQEMRRTIDKIGYWAKGSIGLVPLLGVTWLFGVLYINDDTVIMAYLFTFFNAFQGVYIFLFYCVLNDKVKEDFRRRFCAISRSSSHSFTSSSKKAPRNSAPLSLSAINFPWNQRRGTQTAKDVIVVHDPTIVRNGTSSTGTSTNVNGTFSKRYQDIIREDATVPDDEGAALQGFTIGNGNEHIEYRLSLHSADSRDSGSDLMSPEVTRLTGPPCGSNCHISQNSINKAPLDGEDDDNDDEEDDIEEDDNLQACPDAEDQEGSLEMSRDAADEFEERVMRAIERNIRQTISENDVGIDIYDNETVLILLERPRERDLGVTILSNAPRQSKVRRAVHAVMEKAIRPS